MPSITRASDEAGGVAGARTYTQEFYMARHDNSIVMDYDPRYEVLCILTI